MLTELNNYIETLQPELDKIPKQRKQKLERLADYIRSKHAAGDIARLTFICTHNSRRSHLCQIWASTVAAYFGIKDLQTYSGGTETTAFNPRAVKAIRRAGFMVEHTDGENPRYKIYYNEQQRPLICYSKTFDNEANPQQHFAAVMTCSDADENCPFVPGADKRFSIPYVDPKEADGTPREAEIYDERCRQIASEMYYMLSHLI